MKYCHALLIFSLSVLLQGCGGGGGGSGTGGNASSSPLGVAGSSYENNLAAVAAGFYSLSGVSTLLGGSLDVTPQALAFADFFQEGTFSAVVAARPAGGGANSLYFLKKNGSSWTDATLTFSGLNRQVCTSVKQLLVADLNKDSKPDIYVVCGGGASGPQYYFLSDPSSLGYTRYTSSFNLNAESASIADVDGDANRTPDVVTTDNGTVTVLLSQVVSNALSFTLDNSRLTNLSPIPSGVQAVNLVPRSQSDGTTKYDLIVGGSGSNGTSAVWLKNTGGYFGSVGRSFLLPNLGSDLTYPYAELRGYIESNGLSYIYAMDHAKSLVKLYSYTTPAITLTGTSNTAPALASLQEFSSSSTLPTAGWPSQLAKVGNSFYPLDAACEVTGRCNVMFTLP
jgi:hypothetical protein